MTRTLICTAVCLLVQLPCVAQQTAPRKAVPLDPIEAILDAFKTHQVVTLPGGHAGTELHALLLKLIRDPRFPGAVTDIVVEFGNARYQDLVDRFVRGDEIASGTLKRVWQDTTVPGITNDNPLPEGMLRAVRDVNASLPAERRLRVLLGDPPIDWDHIRRKEDHRWWSVQRSTYAADLIRRDVIARQRRALVVYGNGHFPRREILANYDSSDYQAQTLTSWIESTGHKVFVLFGDGAGIEALQPEIASWPLFSVAVVKGTVLGAADFAAINPARTRYAIRGPEKFEPIPHEQWRTVRVEDQVDAIIYLGKGSTQAPLSPTLCDDPGYAKMRLERIALVGLPPAEGDRVKRLCRIKTPDE